MGVAGGDAMGMPTSLMSPAAIQELFPGRISEFLPAPEGHVIHDKMVAGEVTDDTQQTLVLADLVLETGGFSAEGVARKLIAWAESVNGFDSLILGPSTLRALRMIRDGTPVEEAGWLGDTNGAAMRISPVGIVHPGDFEAVVDDVAEVCKPTHNTNIAIAGASAVACAIAAAMEKADSSYMIDAYFFGIERGMGCGGRWSGASLRHRTEWALDLVRAEKTEEEIWQDIYNYIGTGVAITESVPAAMALVVYYRGDPMRVIEAAANIGGDCDTVGAIAGAMAGAYAGIDAFPRNVVEKIEEVNQFGLDNYARRLAELVLARDNSQG